MASTGTENEVPAASASLAPQPDPEQAPTPAATTDPAEPVLLAADVDDSHDLVVVSSRLSSSGLGYGR